MRLIFLPLDEGWERRFILGKESGSSLSYGEGERENEGGKVCVTRGTIKTSLVNRKESRKRDR